MAEEFLLINPKPIAIGINEATIEVPLGILYIASFLESKGYKCGVIDANAMALSENEVIRKIFEISPLAIGISANAFTYRAALSYARQIKRINPAMPVILGGPQPTAAPELCLEEGFVDAVVVKEGEFAAYKIMENLKSQRHPFKDVDGVLYKDNARILRNPFQKRITDIDKLPFPAYHLLPALKYYKSRIRKWPFMGIITSRGCPFACSFCSKDVFGNEVTFRSPLNVISEIEFLVKHKGIRQIDILDDNFTLDKDRCAKICDLIIKKSFKIAINLQSGVRADNIDRELILLLKRAGVFKIAFGVESGDENTLKRIKKDINLEKILQVNQWARQAGMITVGFFMVGLPYETKESAQKTIDFVKKMNPHIANFMIAIPFYGTALYNLIEKDGKFIMDTKNGVSSGFYGKGVFFELGDFKQDDIEHFYKKAYKFFYFRISKIIDLLGSLRSPKELIWLLRAGVSIFFDR